MVTFNVHGKEYKVVFGYGLLTKTDVLDKYLLVSCKIWNKDQGKFFKAMEKLRNKMPLVGNTDYEEFCKETFKMFD